MWLGKREYKFTTEKITKKLALVSKINGGRVEQCFQHAKMS